MYNFTRDWADEIADVSARPEYQTAGILIEDWSGVTYGETDWATGEREQIGEPVEIYSGRARIVGIRAGSVIEGGDQGNSTTLKSIRFQVPQLAIGRILPGQAVRVTTAPKNPVLLSYVFKVNDDFQGSTPAARTFEAGVDLDATWAA